MRRARHGAGHALLRLQRSVGNRTVAAVLQRQSGVGAQPAANPASLTFGLFQAAYPGIIAAMSFDQMKVWKDIIDGWEFNRGLDAKERAYDRAARAESMSPEYDSYRETVEYRNRMQTMDVHRRFIDEKTSRVKLDPARILQTAEISAAQPWNVDAEQRFRTWVVEYFSAKPLEAELSTEHELASQYERSEHPEIDGGFHANLVWNGARMWSTSGRVGWDDLMRLTEFKARYENDVSNGPHIRALRDGLTELTGHINLMMMQHQALSDANAEHGVVRHVGEALGGPSGMELAVLRMRAQMNPDDTDAQAKLAEKEAETGNYPRMKGPDGIWAAPQQQLNAARSFLQQGEIELAVAAMQQCQNSAAVATARLAGYQRRVFGGVGTAIAWLETAKKLGKIASMFTGTGGVVRAALTAAGYTFAQEGAEQVVAHWIDPENKVDLRGIAEQSAVDGLAALFGGLTQGAFVEALAVRFEARMIATGLSRSTARLALNAAGGTVAGFYNAPAKAVLDHVIAGKAMPKSLSDLCDMVVTESIKSGGMTVVGHYVHASAPGAVEPVPDATAKGPGTPAAEVDALAGAEGAGRRRGAEPDAADYRGSPIPSKAVSAESRAAGVRLEPVRAEWAKLSDQARMDRVVLETWQSVADSLMPLPKVTIKNGAGGSFVKESWTVRLEAKLVGKANLSADEFADLCLSARHEIEHGAQYFRMARQQLAQTGETPLELSTRLDLPLEICRAAAEANKPGSGAEDMSPGSRVDIATKTHYESRYGPNATRDAVYAERSAAKAEVTRASANLKSVKGLPKDAPMRIVAEAEYAKALVRRHAAGQAYLALPMEIAARAAGDDTGQAVREAALETEIGKARAAEDAAWQTIDPLLATIAGNEGSPTSVVDPALQQTLDSALAQWRVRSDRTERLRDRLDKLRTPGPRK